MTQDKSSYVFIIILTATIIGGIWIFGFDDELFGLSYNKESFAQSDNESTFFSEDHIAAQEIQIEQIVEKEIERNSESFVPQKYTYTQQIEKSSSLKKLQAINTKEKMTTLEKRDFVLNGKGTGYMATPANSKPMSINMVLTPVLDSGLTKFQIKTGTFNFDGAPISMKKGVLKISKDKVIITLSQDTDSDPVGTITGSFTDSVIDIKPKDHLIHFENQMISLGSKTHAPIRFTGDWIFSYV